MSTCFEQGLSGNHRNRQYIYYDDQVRLIWRRLQKYFILRQSTEIVNSFRKFPCNRERCYNYIKLSRQQITSTFFDVMIKVLGKLMPRVSGPCRELGLFCAAALTETIILI